MKPTERFTGLADLYHRYRPDYPSAAIDFVVERCQLGPTSLLVDIGSGTGTSSRIFAARGISVVGIEPNADMRRIATEAAAPAGDSRLDYRDGRGEETGLPNEYADAVVAAQAFHWLEADKALAEFHRVLKPGRWVALMWNERDERDDFTRSYGDVLRSTPEGLRLEAHRAQSGYTLLRSPLYVSAERVVFHHQQQLDEDGVVGRARSASYAPREPVALEEFCERLQQAYARYQQNGRVALQYETFVFVGRRP